MKLATSGLLLSFATMATLSAACKPRQDHDDSSTKDISDTESVENNYDGTFRVRCADGRLENGKQVAIVPKPQLQHVCEQNDPNFHHDGGPGGGGGGTNGGNGGGVNGLTLDSCPNATDQMKKLNFAFSADMMPSTDQPAVQKLKFCNGFVTAFGAFLANSPLLFNFLVGDNPNQNGVLIAVGPQTQIVKYDSFGMLSLPWDVKVALPSIIDRMKEQGVTFFLSFSGIRKNVKVSDLTGWVPCYNRPYSDTSSPNDMLAACTKANILIGCGQTSSQVLFDSEPSLIDGIRFVAGEPRALQLHFEPDASHNHRERVLAAWREIVGALSWIVPRAEAIESGWFGPVVNPEVVPRIGDIIVAARKGIAYYDSRVTSNTGRNMVGQHGSWSTDELAIPLLRFGAFAR